MEQSQTENNRTVQEKNELCTDFQTMNANLYVKTGMTIEESLNDQLNHYREALLNCDDKDKKSIQAMIDQTRNIILQYNQLIAQGEETTLYSTLAESDKYTAYTGYIFAAIAYFNASGYLLSAELLTHSYSLNFTPGVYVPINGTRVLSSSKTYDILNRGLLYEESLDYPLCDGIPSLNTMSRNEEDLGFAIRHFNYQRESLSSKTVTILDTYNYDYKIANEDSSVFDKAFIQLLNIYNEAQNMGLLREYPIEITIDLSEPLKIESVEKNQTNNIITVRNFSGQPLELIYNSKMCFENDVKNWTGLTDIQTLTIGSNSSVRLSVAENGTATHIALSYLKNGKRIITYVDGISNSTAPNVEMNKVNYFDYGDIALVGKNGNKWLIKIRNTYGETKTVQYNTKMCFENDAKNWSGLNDVSTFSLAPGQEKTVSITENFMADSIAIRFWGTKIIYANQLNANGSMNVKRIDVS